MTPEKLLEQLKTGASNKIQETLDAVYEVCSEQRDRGVHDFTIASIAKLGFKRGVPKAQSIRNKSGEKYRILIDAFSEHSSKKAKLKKPSQTQTDWIDEIENPKHQLLTRILASELKEANQIIRELIPPKQRIDVYDYRNMPEQESFKLTEPEIRALKYLLSDDFKKKWLLKETEYGELVDENNSPVFKVATTDALRKTLEHLS
jgi:hypothetical protein